MRRDSSSQDKQDNLMSMLSLHLCLNRNKQSEVIKSNCLRLQIKMKKMRGHSSRTSLRGGEKYGKQL